MIWTEQSEKARKWASEDLSKGGLSKGGLSKGGESSAKFSVVNLINE